MKTVTILCLETQSVVDTLIAQNEVQQVTEQLWTFFYVKDSMKTPLDILPKRAFLDFHCLKFIQVNT